MKNNAQGTIEYLVIMAIVVVIGLIVVGIASSFLDTNSTNSLNKIGQKIGKGGISILESVSDFEGDNALVLKNTSGETLTITKITNENNKTYFDEQITQSEDTIFLLEDFQDSCSCSQEETSKTCTFKIYYTTKNGINKTETFQTTVNCVSDTIPTQTPAQTKYFTFGITTTSNNQSFTIQIDDSEDLYVTWGDGTTETLSDESALRSHTYSTAGDYNISMNGTATRISFYEGTEELLQDIYTPISEGITGLTSAENMFRGIDVVSFSSETFFDEASSGITNMSKMFYGTNNFNQNIESWDVGNVTTMSDMFAYAYDFNQSLNNWNTQSLESTFWMFTRAYDFNQPLNNWNTSNVTNMSAMFYEARTFNQPIGDWDTSKVTSMTQMFENANDFNQPIGDWDTQSLESTSKMFYSADNFNQSLNNWDTSNVLHM